MAVNYIRISIGLTVGQAKWLARMGSRGGANRSWFIGELVRYHLGQMEEEERAGFERLLKKHAQKEAAGLTFVDERMRKPRLVDKRN